jgi:hypothetical protein
LNDDQTVINSILNRKSIVSMKNINVKLKLPVASYRESSTVRNADFF